MERLLSGIFKSLSVKSAPEKEYKWAKCVRNFLLNLLVMLRPLCLLLIYGLLAALLVVVMLFVVKTLTFMTGTHIEAFIEPFFALTEAS